MNDELTPERSEIIAGLVELADFLAENPDVPFNPTIFHWADVDAAGWGVLASTLAPCEKSSTTGYAGGPGDLVLNRKFRGITFSVRTSQARTCERIQIDTRIEKRPVLPEGVEFTYEDAEVPVYGWQCPESFLALKDQA